MSEKECDIIHPNGVKEKRLEVVDGFTIKYHANNNTVWSKGKIINELPEGYWEWYRVDGTLKRSIILIKVNLLVNGLPMMRVENTINQPIVLNKLKGFL